MVASVCISASEISCRSERNLVRRAEGNAEGFEDVTTTLEDVSVYILSMYASERDFENLTDLYFACRRHHMRGRLCGQC